jgi:hypothetical protein
MALGTPPVNNGGVSAGFKSLDPAKYTSLGDFIDEVNAPDNRDLLVKTYGKLQTSLLALHLVRS